MLPVLLALLAACPRAPVEEAPPPWPEGPDHLYVVQWGDTLTWIADDWGVPGGYAALARHNGLWDPDWIDMGQHLRIPHTPAAAESLPTWPHTDAFTGAIQECPATRWAPEPVESWLSGCEQSACTDLGGGHQACGCWSPEASSVVITRMGAEVQRWPAPMSRDRGDPPWEVLGTARDLRAVATDLDGDGAEEWLVLTLDRANDVGMSWWHAALLDDPSQPPLTFELGNAGQGTLVARPGGGCDLLATEWAMDEDEAMPWPGYYLTGRTLRWTGSSLEAVQGAPILARRLLYSFEPGAVPTADIALGTPAADLSTPATLVRSHEPEVTWQRLGSWEGPIGGVGLDDNPRRRQLSVVVGGHSATPVARVCDGLAGVCLPAGLVPWDEAWERGRHATASRYRYGGWGGDRVVVWLGPR